jgi:hypothetical protein
MSLVLACTFRLIASAAAIIIDHTNFDDFSDAGLPAETVNAVNALKVYFAHASVGGNIVNGMSDLRSANPARYKMLCPDEDGTPPATTVGGNMYHYMRGNPGWSAKITLFETYLAAGWGAGKVDIAINKFCYVDQAAGFTQYRDSMVAQEALYPGTKFVYMTIPLTTSEDSAGYLRQVFNQQLRAFCAANGKILIDIADIEAWSPLGVQQTYVYNSTVCQKMCAGYTTDGGHLSVEGRDRVALGFYAAFMAIVGAPQSIQGWQVVATHGALRPVATAISDNYVEPSASGLTTLRATFGAALAPATLGPGAVTVVGQAGGNVSGLVSSLTLDATGRVLTIGLSAAAPNADVYTVTITSQVTHADGSALEGDRDIVVKALVGDVSSSGQVSAADLLALRSRASAAPLTSDTAPYDVDNSGAISGADLLAIRARLGTHLP